MDQKKIANNILEFLVNPRAFPVERRLYFRSEELLDNSSYEKAEADAKEAYGDQSQNSNFYPNRNRSTKREASVDRKTLIASMDILSQSFTEEDPIAKDLRTMAYAISKMSEEELENRVVEAGKGKGKGKGFMPPWLDPDFKKDEKKAEEETPEPKEASEEISIDNWSKEASDAVQRALISDVLGDVVAKKSEEEEDDDEGGESEACDAKKAGKKKGPGVPDGTGPLSGTPECKMNEEKKEKEAKADPKKEEAPADPKKEEAPAEEPVAAKKAEDEKEAETVDTDILATMEVDGIQLTAGLTTMDDIGDLSDEEQSRLGQLFR